MKNYFLVFLFFLVQLAVGCQLRPAREAYRTAISREAPVPAPPGEGNVEDSARNHGGDVTTSEAGKDTCADDEQAIALALPAPLKSVPELILHREGYVCSFNRETLIPNWVAWHLTSYHTGGGVKRGGIEFTPDSDVPEDIRVTTFDYMRSGFDRGHMCPAGDNKWGRTAMEQCFLMTNMCPQSHGLNAGDWNELEGQCRRWAKKYGDIYIVCGPILYGGKHRHIGKVHRVTVPEAFFKVVLCLKGKPKGIAFIYKNKDGNRPKGDYVNTIDQVERITGINFFAQLPDNVEQEVEAEANLADW